MLNVLEKCTSLHLIWNACLLTLQQQQAIDLNQTQACVPLVCMGLLSSDQVSASSRPQQHMPCGNCLRTRGRQNTQLYTHAVE